MLAVSLKKGIVRSRGSDDCSASREKMSGWSVAQLKAERRDSKTKMTFFEVNI